MYKLCDASALANLPKHTLIQWFPEFENLHALHIITLRSAEPELTLQDERLKFAIDSLAHCPNVKLRYLAMGEKVQLLEQRPLAFRTRLNIVMDRRRSDDKKGKGKAVDRFGDLDFIDHTSDRELDETLEAIPPEDRKRRFSTPINSVKGVRIFSKQIRSGKL